MRVVLVISSMGRGGAEGAMARVANHAASLGWDVTLVTFDEAGETPFHELAPAIRRRGLGIACTSPTALHAMWNNVRHLPVLRGAIEQARPQVVVSFMDTCNLRTLLATRGMDVPVVVCERVDPRQHSIGPVWERLRRRLYPRAALVVVQSEASREYFALDLRERIRVIPNAVSLPTGLPPRGPSESGHPTLIAMGRLTRQKGFDLLLEALGRIEDRLGDWDVVIWGEGEERGRLEALSARLGLVGRVRLPGLTSHPFREFRRSELFVLSSRFEGFPNVLCEAMACGLPAVCFDCPTGPGEIVRDGEDGLLVAPGDVEGLARALDDLVGDGPKRERLARRAPEVLDRFGGERIMKEWEAVFEEASRRGERSRA